MVQILYQLRKVQFLSSSFNTCIFLNKGLFILQIALLGFGALSTIVGRFYFWERYHLYGCRADYQEGFPVMCPISRRPASIDGNTAYCYGLALVSLIMMMVVPILWSSFHWKCTLGTEIKHMSDKVLEKNKITDDQTKLSLQNTLLSLEHVNSYCRRKDCTTISSKPVETHKFLVHLGSCLWSELFILCHYKRWGPLIVIVMGILLSVALPCFMAMSLHGWNLFFMVFGMLLFLVVPLFSSILILILIPCITAHSPHIVAIGVLVCWCAVNLATIVFSFVRENHDELSITRYSYHSDLHLYLKDVRSMDVDVMLYIRGYGELI